MKLLRTHRTSNPDVARSSRAGRTKPSGNKGLFRRRPFSIFLLSLLLGFLVTTPAGAADPWSKQDIALEGVYLVLHLIDWGQTRQIANDPEHYHEMNPIIGKHPSTGRVDVYMATSALLHLGVTHFLPKECRPYFQGVTLAMQGTVVMHNFSIGLGFSW